MTKWMAIEHGLDTDPLAVRLSAATVPPISSELRLSLLSACSARPFGGSRRRLAIGLTIAALAVALGMILTPVGAVVARSVLPQGMQQFFGIVSGAPVTLSPPSNRVTPMPGTSPVPCSQVPPPTGNLTGVLCYPDLSLAAAQNRVTFTIPTPSTLPNGVTYYGAIVDSPRSVMLSYRSVTKASAGLGLSIDEGTQVGGSAVPSGSLEPVQVDGNPAYYVRGDYESSGPGAVAHWNPNGNAEELTWRQNGLTFDMTSGGLHLSEAEFIHIAESVS
jgi:hypothetical protein